MHHKNLQIDTCQFLSFCVPNGFTFGVQHLSLQGLVPWLGAIYQLMFGLLMRN